MPLKTIIRLMYIQTFFSNLVFILPVIVLYYQNQLGLSFQTLMLGEAIFAAVVIAFEVPSGWMSDLWSRKGTLVMGAIVGVIGYGGMLLADGLWMVLFFQAVIGIHVAFNSGTVSAMLYDHLAHHDKTHLYQKLEGKRHAMRLYSVAIGAVIGGLAYAYNPYLPLILDVTTLAIAAILVAMLIEPKRVKRESDGNPVRDMAITMKYALHGHKEIAGIIIVSMILFSSTKMFMWVQQPYMQMVEIPTHMFGFIMAGGFVLSGLCGHFGHYIRHSLSNRHVMIILTAYTAILAIAAAITTIPAAIIFIVLVSPVWGFGFPFVHNAINKHADPARRATILSTMGLCISLMFIPASLCMGWANDEISPRAALMFLAGYLAILTPVGFYLWGRPSVKTIPSS